MNYVKYFLTSFLLLVLPSLVSAQEKVLNQENLQVRYGIYYEKRKRGPFTGKAFDQKYVNGQWKILNYFKEGRIVGTEKFAKNGEVFYESGENETAHRLKRKEGIERIKREINTNWNVAALTTSVDYEKYKVILEIKIDPNGNLVGPVKIIYPYKPEGRFIIAKRAAVKAVLDSTPFAISKKMFPEGITLKIKFDPATTMGISD